MVVDFAGVNFVDSQGAEQLRQLVELAERDGWSLRLARVRGSVHAVIDADGVLDRLGADHLHGNVDQAVAAHTSSRSEASIGRPSARPRPVLRIAVRDHRVPAGVWDLPMSTGR